MPNEEAEKLIRIARLIAIALGLFLLLFCLDVFAMEGSTSRKLIGFIIHSLPSLVIAAILALTWRNPFLSGLSFFLLAALFAFVFRTYDKIGTFIMLTVVPVLIGILFLLAVRRQAEDLDTR
ncbi:MAG: hypothetical protein GX998_04360 [Firmicutes bacterium]|nr:hypothetical protein [Bacillota bacterium]